MAWYNDALDSDTNKDARDEDKDSGYSPEPYDTLQSSEDRAKSQEEAAKAKLHDWKAEGEEKLHNAEDTLEEDWDNLKHKL